MDIREFSRVLSATPTVIRRRRARGGLTHKQFKDASLTIQICVLVHCFLCASLWWARIHSGLAGSWSNWLGVGMAIAWVIFFWGFLLKQAYNALEVEVAREIQR
ncbi:hypothetical protein [Paraburkholderia guartelaensis]|uniref:hypothetical protein n=1 Tax=Paraburkholderia guartelaensis TaxID=2546446 RepID=UPI002AB6B01A|nr:hypothetical protein [Paraburkholderia guartelaensis]